MIVAAPVGVLLYIAGLTGSLLSKQRLLGLEWSQLLEAPSMIVAGWIGAPLYSIWHAVERASATQNAWRCCWNSGGSLGDG